jgi:pimeloyl-ACP methyl ester carboxylesterase
VNQTTKTRELFALNCQGVLVHGTCHLAPTLDAMPNHAGILFLPGFPMPRSAHGDAAVYWANSFAELGYPSFRIDLPGTGDSFGNVPAELLQYLIAGGYERVVVAALEQLTARYNLPGLVILGHCAGAISAIFAAANCKECRGLILLDPPFHVQPAGRRKVQKAVFYWSSRTRLGGMLSDVYDYCKRIWLHLRRNAPPKNANFALLKRWKQVASSGLPILLLNAPAPKSTGAQPRVGKFDYLQHILKLAGGRSRVDVRTIENANHAFSNPSGRNAVRKHVEDWMPTFFPLEEPVPAAEEAATTMPSISEAQFANPSIFARVDATLGS